MSDIDQQFIEFVVKSLVNNPDDVSIERTIDEKGVLLMLTVNPEDLGRVIGKRGATAQSLRTLLRALGTKNEARYNLKIVDNGEPRPERDNRRDEQRDNRPAAPAPVSSSSDDKPEDMKVEDAKVEETPVEPAVEEKVEEKTPDVDGDSLTKRTLDDLEGLDDLEI